MYALSHQLLTGVKDIKDYRVPFRVLDKDGKILTGGAAKKRATLPTVLEHSKVAGGKSLQIMRNGEWVGFIYVGNKLFN